MSCGANGEQNGERNGEQDGEGLVSKTSVKIGCFGLAPLASVNSVYLALWCVFRFFYQIACVKQSTFLSAPRHRSSADLTLCLTPVVIIYLKMSPNRR